MSLKIIHNFRLTQCNTDRRRIPLFHNFPLQVCYHLNYTSPTTSIKIKIGGNDFCLEGGGPIAPPSVMLWPEDIESGLAWFQIWYYMPLTVPWPPYTKLWPSVKAPYQIKAIKRILHASRLPTMQDITCPMRACTKVSKSTVKQLIWQRWDHRPYKPALQW